MAAAKNKHEIKLTRVYDAPVKAVWEAWTDPAKAAKWWGPRGFTLTTHNHDLRTGGHWHYTMHGPDGTDYENTTQYLDVVPMQRMIYDHGGHKDRPPLFRVDVPARGKKPAAKQYALDEGELHAILDKAEKDGVAREKCQISRFKGLGEMNAEQLWDTTLNPDTRRLLQVTLGAMDFAATESLITRLMGKGEAAARRELMELHGDSVEVDV